MLAGEDAHVVPVEFIAAHLHDHVELRGRGHEGRVRGGVDALATGAHAIRHPAAAPAGSGVIEIGAAFAHRARREAIGTPRRSVWSVLYGVAALDFRIGLGQGDIRTRQRPVHHRTAHRATRIVRVRQRPPRGRVHSGGRMIGLREIRALETGHVQGLARIACHRARGRLTHGPDGLRRGFRRLVLFLGDGQSAEQPAGQ